MTVYIYDPSLYFPNISHIEMLLGGVTPIEYDDGTFQFVSTDEGEQFVYSPRLPKRKLELFCRDHRDQYQKISDENIAQVAAFLDFKIEPFWGE